MITSLYFCSDIYSGFIWDRKYIRYWETVQKQFRIEQRNLKASTQNICKYCWLLRRKSACDEVQVVTSECCPACYMC